MGIAGTIAKNTVFSFISSASEVGISFVASMVLTRGLGTEQYGLYSYAIWLSALAGYFSNLGLGEMSRRFIPEGIGRQSTREPAGFAQLALVFRIATALVVGFAIIISSGYWARLSGDSGDRFIFILVAASILPDALQQALVAIFKGFQKFDYSLYISLVMYPLRLVLIILLVNLGFGVQEIFILNIATLTLGVLVSFYLLRHLVPLKILFSPSLLSSDRKKEALKYSFAVGGVILIGYLVSQQAEVFFIGLYCSVEDVGFYTLAFRIGSLAGLLPAAFTYVLLPAIAEQFGKRDMEKMKSIYLNSLRYLMIVALPLATGGIALADSLITVLYGAEYSPAIILFQIICLPTAIYSISMLSDYFIRGINHPGFLLKTMVIFAILNIGLSYWLIPRYGILGATIANIVIIVPTLPVYTIFIYKKCGIIWPWRDAIKIIIASLVMGVAIYILHNHLSAILSLVLCIPLGIVIFFIAIFALRVIKEQDLVILKGIQNSLPLVLRKHSLPLVGLMERVVLRTKLTNGR